MPVTFAYHQASDEVAHDIDNHADLTAEEAQVLATLQVSQALNDIRDVMKDMLHLAEKELDRLDPPG